MENKLESKSSFLQSRYPNGPNNDKNWASHLEENAKSVYFTDEVKIRIENVSFSKHYLI